MDYGTPEGAARYREKHRGSLLRRLASRRETSLFDRALSQAGGRGPVLDCPCGTGRLGAVLLRRAGRVVAADLSAAMLGEAAAALAGPAAERRVAFVRAPAEALPFPDRAFETVVCSRLVHHVTDPSARARLLRELARVAGRWVVLSFHDATTLKRRLQGKRPRRRAALTPAQLTSEADDAGLALVPPIRRVNGWFSLLAVALLRVER